MRRPDIIRYLDLEYKHFLILFFSLNFYTGVIVTGPKHHAICIPKRHFLVPDYQAFGLPLFIRLPEIGLNIEKEYSQSF